MVYHLEATHFDAEKGLEIKNVFELKGDTFDDILAKIEAHPQHKANLKKYGKTSMRDARGVLHRLVLKEIIGPH